MDNNSKKVEHLGFSQYYKIPFTHSVHSLMADCHTATDIDLTQAVFGYTSLGEENKWKRL